MPKMPKRNRREARETAFSLLFEWSFHEYQLDDMIAAAARARDIVPDEFTLELTRKAIDYHVQIDSLIESRSENWRLGRISRVTLAALRIAFCELEYFDDIPPGATINEAVELVKLYGTEDEAAYLNGVLGAYVRETGGENPGGEG